MYQLHERLQKEGIKTHKERVEELNKYLSRLSEHHDMYVLIMFLIPFVWPHADHHIGRRLDRVKTRWQVTSFRLTHSESPCMTMINDQYEAVVYSYISQPG